MTMEREALGSAAGMQTRASIVGADFLPDHQHDSWFERFAPDCILRCPT